MKNQYFGDINDYRKYGLLRCILNSSKLNMLTAWMLTPDDSSTDGRFIEYLENPDKFRTHDPELYDFLRKHLVTDKGKRAVSVIENAEILPLTSFYSDIVPDDSPGRMKWFEGLKKASENCGLVFLDPDNGLEIKSTEYGKKKSSKFLYWREVTELWNMKKSLLIYQHFPRVQRDEFINTNIKELKAQLKDGEVAAFTTSRVVFFLALQNKHQNHLCDIISNVEKHWNGEIEIKLEEI